MKTGICLTALLTFAQIAFAGWQYPPPPGTGGMPTPPPRVIEAGWGYPSAPGTVGRPTPPPKVIQVGWTYPPPGIQPVSDQEQSTYCGKYVANAYKTIVENINNKECPAKLLSAKVTYKGIQGDGIDAEEVYEIEGKTSCDNNPEHATLTFVVDSCDLNRVRMHLNDNGT